MLLNYKLCMCCLRSHFLSRSLLFTPNTGHYIPMYPWSAPNDMRSTPKVHSGFVPVSAVPSVCWEGTGREGGFAVLCARSSFRETMGRGGLKWVSLHLCTQFDLGARYLLWQAQCRAWCPVWFLGPQGTWESRSANHPGVWPRYRDCNPDITQSLTYKTRFIHFEGHNSTQSGNYYFGLLAQNTINQEDKRRIYFPWLWQCCLYLSLLIFPHQSKILSIPSGFQFSTSASPNLTSRLISF